MDYLLGALISVVFFILLLTSVFIGYQIGHKKTIPPPIETDDEELRRAKKLQEDFAKLMSYDVDKALQSKKVTAIE